MSDDSSKNRGAPRSRPSGGPRGPHGGGARGGGPHGGSQGGARPNRGGHQGGGSPWTQLPDSPRVVAAAALARVLDDGGWAAPSLSQALEGSTLDDRDKGLCTELFYGALRFAGPLERSLLRAASKPAKKLDKRMRPHVLIAAYQLQHLSDRIPAHAAVKEAIDAVKRVRPGLDGFANALLRNLGSPLHELLKPSASLVDIAEAWGVPLPLARAIADDLPLADQAAAVAGLCARPRTWARAFVPTTGPARQRGTHQLGPASTPPGQSDIPESTETKELPTPHPFVPGCYILGGGKVSDVDGFRDGTFVVMDPGSALCALAVAAVPGAKVLDLCAAPGSKAMVLADAVGAKGLVLAVEQDARRAERLTENAHRLGPHIEARLEVRIGDAGALVDELIGKHGDAGEAGAGKAGAAGEATFRDAWDAVLLDAPCSALGTTRRRPEVKLRKTDDDIQACVALQRSLLAAAADYVRPGGVLVYSVCSPMPEEGPEQVAAFLAQRPDYVLEPLPSVLPWLPKNAVDVDGCVRLRPHLHDADAFFIARLRRHASTEEGADTSSQNQNTTQNQNQNQMEQG